MIDIEHRDYRDTLKRAAELGGADLIVTSPPYPSARPGQYGGDASHDFAWPDYQALGDAVYGGLRPGGFCAIVIDGPVRMWRSKAIGSERSLIAFKLAIDWAERVGLRYVEHCAYVRDGVPGLFGHRWRSGWEPLHVFQRPGADGFFNVRGMEVVARQAGKLQRPGTNRTAGKRRQNYHRITRDTKSLTTALVGRCGMHVTDIDHPAVFAPIVADAFVLCYTAGRASVRSVYRVRHGCRERGEARAQVRRRRSRHARAE